MCKSTVLFAFVYVTLFYQTMAGPVEVEKPSDDDLKTAETFGFGYYQPRVYSAPFVNTALPLATSGVISAPLTNTAALTSASARSGYDYGSAYKYGSGYGYGSRWGYGSGGAVNEFYRRRPVYVAWG